MNQVSKAKRGVLGNLTSRLATELAEGTAAGAAPLQRPRSAPGHLLEFTGVTKELEQANQELAELRKQKASGFEVELSKLRTSPYQTGGLVEARVNALVANLRQNPLNTPIVVRETSEPGVYEIVAGHHRVEAYRILERETISAVLRQISDDEAERVVFYDNLLAPALSDYEKYLGFAQRQKTKQLSQEELAAEAGVSREFVAKLLAFQRLPQGAQDIIKESPRTPGFGGNFFYTMAALDAKFAEKVVEAVQLVAAGKLTATAAPGWVTAAPRTERPAAERLVVKRGRTKFAEITSRGKQWSVTFTTEEDALRYRERLLSVVQHDTDGG